LRKVLYIFGLLADSDVEWIAHTGTRRAVKAGEVLVEEGVGTDSVIILLEGEMAVTVKSVGEVARLGTGEIVGEMSFIDAAPPSATVTVTEPGLALFISKAALGTKLRTDLAFASRFYYALAVFLADRLRGTVRRLGYGEVQTLTDAGLAADDPGIQLLDNLAMAGDRFQRMLTLLSHG
jgi:CRP-like cAMP-binding protein